MCSTACSSNSTLSAEFHSVSYTQYSIHSICEYNSSTGVFL